MQPPQNHSRVNLAELKAQLVKKIGPEGSKQYFYYLNMLLNLKLNKIEFNKLCIRIIGRDNIPLHNQLIRSILKNVCTAKAPPAVDHPGLANGVNVLPRKARMCNRVRSNGKASLPSDFNVVLENGLLSPTRKENERVEVERPVGVGLYRNGRHVVSSINDVGLLDSVRLRERMEEIGVMHGLEGVLLDCANAVNHGLDTYLKRIIRSCIGSRSGDVISLQDFRVAMELNPVQLGEDWGLMLEKICRDAFEE